LKAEGIEKWTMKDKILSGKAKGRFQFSAGFSLAIGKQLKGILGVSSTGLILHF